MRLLVILVSFISIAGAAFPQEPDSVQQFLITGAKAFNSNMWKESKEAYENALRLQPGNVEALRNLGLIANTLGDLQTAMHYYEEVLKHDSLDASTHNNIGVVMSERGKTADAIRAFEKAIRIDSTNNQCHVNLAGEYIKIQRFSDAARHLRRSVAADTVNPEPPYLMGRAMFGLRRNDSALTFFRASALRGGEMS